MHTKYMDYIIYTKKRLLLYFVFVDFETSDKNYQLKL